MTVSCQNLIYDEFFKAASVFLNATCVESGLAVNHTLPGKS